jgi:hypothetical protein
VSMATSAYTTLWGFFLSSSLLKASQQPVRSADRHPSEITRGDEKNFTQCHSPTHI